MPLAIFGFLARTDRPFCRKYLDTNFRSFTAHAREPVKSPLAGDK
ncbi:hypothetical protein [Natrinema sp. HArc-T2]